MLNGQFLPKESHLMHDDHDEVELQSVLLRVHIVVCGLAGTLLSGVTINKTGENATELFLEAFDAVLLALLQSEL